LGLKPIELVQTIAITVGFAVTIWQLRDSGRLRRFEVFWRIGDSHRETWRPLIEHPELIRILDPNPDLSNRPISTQERQFATRIILHVENVYKAHREGYYKFDLGGEGKDIGELIELPIIQNVWTENRGYLDPHFVRFIQGLKRRNRESKEPMMKLVRRLSDIPKGLYESRGGSRCPDVWETDAGDYVIIGDDVTDELRQDLPQYTDISGPERAVLVPKEVFAAAVRRFTKA